MIAIEIREPGDPDVLVPVERPIPTPGSGEVLIKVAAASVNRPELRHHETTEQKLATKARRHEGRKARVADRVVEFDARRGAARRTRGRELSGFSWFRRFVVSWFRGFVRST